MHIKDHSAAMKFFRTYDNVASKGKWKEFVDEMEFDSMLQESRTLVADASTEMEQSPDSFLRPKRYDILTGLDVPAETLEDWDTTFRNPNAEGGVQQLVQNTVDGSRPGYKGDDTVVDKTVRRYNYDKSIKQKLETIYKNIQEYKNIKTFPTAAKEAEIIKRLKNFALDFKEATGRLPVANEIRSYGVASQIVTSGKKGTYLIEDENFMVETDDMRETKWRTREVPEIQTKIIEASKSEKYMKPDGSPNIRRMAKDFYPDKKLDDARKQIRETLKRETDYIPKENVPGDITSAKQARKNALENIKIAQKKAGINTTKQADQVINKILSQNEIYQNMPVEDIAKDKDLLKRLRIQIDSVTGDVTFKGYTKENPVKGKVFSDLELAQHAKNKAMNYELFTPDHITSKSLRKQNVGYPINFQSTTYMENSHLANARTYLMNNPDGNYQAIDNYLSSKNLTIRGSDFKRKYGFKLPIIFDSKTGTSNIVELSAQKIRPKGTSGFIARELVEGTAKSLGKGAGTAARLARTLGVEFEAAFIALDFMNNLGKGIEPGEALQKSLQTASFNLYKGGDRKTIENIKKVAEELGFDPKVMDSLIKVNQSQLKIGDLKKKISSHEGALVNLKSSPNKRIPSQWISDVEKKIPKLKKELEKEIEVGINLFNTYATNVKRSKGSFKLTEDDVSKSFTELHTAGFELLKKKQIKSAKQKSTQVDLEAGPIGDVIQNALGGLWTYPKFAYDVINPFSPLPKKDAWKTEGMKEKERIIDMQKKGGPGELYRYNIARGFDIDQPATGQAFQTMKEEQPYLGFRMEKAEGGIMSLKKKR